MQTAPAHRPTRAELTREIQRQADQAATLFKADPNDPRLKAMFHSIGLLGFARAKAPEL